MVYSAVLFVLDMDYEAIGLRTFKNKVPREQDDVYTCIYLRDWTLLYVIPINKNLNVCALTEFFFHKPTRFFQMFTCILFTDA